MGMATVTDYDVFDEMERSGGGFVKALAAAARKADAENLRRIKKGFPEYWATYSQRAAFRKDAAAAGGEEGE